MARASKEEAKDELPGTCIEVLDSRNVTAAEDFVALAGGWGPSSREGKGFSRVDQSS